MPSRIGPWDSASSTASPSAPPRARAVHGLERVAVIDFDVHHGNGTQAMFESDPALFYASTHQSPLYPGTGAASEHGVGNIVNVPLRADVGLGRVPPRLRRAAILPALEDFRPELDHDLGRLRRPSPRSAGPAHAGRGRLRLGHRAAHGRCARAPRRGPPRLVPRRRLRPRRRWRRAPPPMCGR